MKKIAIITPFLARGGLEKVAIVEAAELSKLYDVTLIVLDSFIQDYPFEGKMIDIGVSLENRGILRRIINIFLTATRLKKIKKKYSFDLIISHGELANIPNVLSGGKVILTVHENRFAAFKDSQGKLVNKVINFAYKAKNVQKVVTVSEGIRESFLKNLDIGDQHILTIHNPHNLREITEKSREPLYEYEILFKNPVLINVGRLIYQKGQWYLLRIFKEIKKNNKDIKLVILGDADLRKKLILLANQLELDIYSSWSNDSFSDKFDVYLLGFHENPFKFMAKSRFFVMTSLREGLPNTIIESLACGTPVISTDCKSGPREILFPKMEQNALLTQPEVGKYGVLMPEFKDEKFLDANVPLTSEEKIWVSTLKKILNQDETTFKSNNCIERSKDFEMNKIILKWKNLIDQYI